MTDDELQNMADTYGLYTEEDVENRISCRLLAVGFRNEELEKENAELKAKNKWYSEQVCNKECAEVWGKLTKAKEHIQTLISCLIDWVQEGDKDYCHIAEAEKFLKGE